MKDLLKKIKKTFDKLVTFGFNALKSNSGLAVIITQNLKIAVESGIVKGLVDLIPHRLAPVIYGVALKIIPQVAIKVAIAHNILKASDSNSDIIGKLIEELSKLTKDERKGIWIDFAAKLNVYLSDGDLSWKEAVDSTQEAYRILFKK
jgi:hypothetical protein